MIASTDSNDFWRGKTVLVTGGDGFLGGHLTDTLRARGVSEDRLRLPTFPKSDLRRRKDCVAAVRDVQVVIHLAAKVGGIGLNKERPAELFYENALMGLQLMEEARLAGIEKFVTIGTTCEYPKVTPVPFLESALWDGYPDEVTGPYGLAKKMLLVQAQTYRTQYGFNSIHLIPTNLYGPRDHFDEVHGHVIPSLIKRFVEAAESHATEVTVWGTGRATREFIYVEDAALGIAQAAEAYERVRPGQPWLRRGNSHSRAGGAGGDAGRIHGRDPLGRFKARRPAAEEPRCVARPRAIRLHREDAARPGAAPHRGLVPGEPLMIDCMRGRA